MVIENPVLFFDILFFIVFTIGVGIFLYTHRKNLGREGIMFIYRTKIGIKKIDKFAKKHKRVLNFLSYISIVVGAILMVSVVLLLVSSLWTYISEPIIRQTIKAPPVLPLLPYVTEIPGVSGLLPTLTFSYFLIAFLVIAFVHEFAHGIFMRLYKVKIKSTGFAFLGPILGAFVEQDETQMKKVSTKKQLSIISAGVFSNIIFAVVFFFIMFGFFNFSYSSDGVVFNDYASTLIETNSIISIQNYSDNYVQIKTQNETFYWLKNIEIIKNENYTFVYLDSPALKSNLKGSISFIDGEKIESPEKLYNLLSEMKPNKEIIITTKQNNSYINQTIKLSTNPLNNSKAFLGISSSGIDPSAGPINFLFFTMGNLNEKLSAVDYSENYYGANYFLFLLWWITIINFFVALFNMLPVGIFDGGLFFYLTVLSTTKSEKIAKRFYKISSWFIGLIFILFIAVWLVSL
jgi:membrane-associated protease RseP (regulator of RpoE activity)